MVYCTDIVHKQFLIFKVIFNKLQFKSRFAQGIRRQNKLLNL